jgi:uncharacterized protein YfbU (UPF0304 family)
LPGSNVNQGIENRHATLVIMNVTKIYAKEKWDFPGLLPIETCAVLLNLLHLHNGMNVSYKTLKDLLLL